jgi:30S ribosomal protein S31
MGKGDKKSRRGKIHIGSFGVRRNRKPGKKSAPPVSKVEEPVKKPKAKAPAKPKPAKTEAPVVEVETTPVEVVVKPAAKKTTATKSTSKKSKTAEPPAEEAG